ncbi:hypothetical protein ABZ757_30980, partial [Streptomyces albidoflavus]
MTSPLPICLVQSAARHHASAGALDAFAADVRRITRTHPGTRLLAFPELHEVRLGQHQDRLQAAVVRGDQAAVDHPG